MPKKSRRDRKRAAQQATSNVASGVSSTAEATSLTEMQFTDFGSSDVATTEAGADTRPQPPIADDSVESVLEREDQALKQGQGKPPVPYTVDNGPTLPEVERTLRRVQRKQPVAGRATPAKKTEIPLPELSPDSAAIPLSQVPYVPSDLRRVAFSALIIIVVIVVGGILVTNAIH